MSQLKQIYIIPLAAPASFDPMANFIWFTQNTPPSNAPSLVYLYNNTSKVLINANVQICLYNYQFISLFVLNGVQQPEGGWMSGSLNNEPIKYPIIINKSIALINSLYA